MKRAIDIAKTTLIGGLVFLLPLIVALYVLGQGLALAAGVVQPLAAALPFERVGGVAVVTLAALALLLALCFAAGVLARAAAGRALSARFESKLNTLYPRYAVIKAMSQGLHDAAGQPVLKAVLVEFDDHELIAFDIERLDDGRVVIFLPGSPDTWSGSVVLVAPERIKPLAIDPVAFNRALQGLGKGTAALLRRAAPP
jgi:uncharacterized membrane protein